MNKLYSNMDQNSSLFFAEQEARIKRDTETWKQYAEVIAVQEGLSEESVRKMIASYEDEETYKIEQKKLQRADTLYKGLNEKDRRYFEHSKTLLERDTAYWEKRAEDIARTSNISVEAARSLIDAYNKEQMELIEIEELRTSDKIADGFKAAGIVIRREMQTWGEKAYDITMQISSSLESGLMSILEDVDDWGEAVKRTLKEIYLEAMRLAVVKPIADQTASYISSAIGIIGGAFSGAGNSGTGTGSGSGSFEVVGGEVAPQALGNAFSNGRIVAFANGGLFSRPTFFPMADGNVGLMGEAGPEAVMPLTRDSHGQLGVSSEGNTELVATVKELLYATRKQKIVQPILIDRREDVATVEQKRYLKRSVGRARL